MVSGWNLWVWLVSVVVRRYIIERPKKHLKINKEVRMLLPKEELIQAE